VGPRGVVSDKRVYQAVNGENESLIVRWRRFSSAFYSDREETRSYFAGVGHKRLHRLGHVQQTRQRWIQRRHARPETVVEQLGGPNFIFVA